MTQVEEIMAKLTPERLRAAAQKHVEATLRRQKYQQDRSAQVRALKVLIQQRPEVGKALRRILKGEPEILVVSK